MPGWNIDYSSPYTWEQIIKDNINDIANATKRPKCEFYKALGIPYTFWTCNEEHVRLSMTLDKDIVICEAKFKRMINESFKISLNNFLLICCEI